MDPAAGSLISHLLAACSGMYVFYIGGLLLSIFRLGLALDLSLLSSVGVQFPALMSNLFGDTIRIVGLSQVTSSASSMPRSMKLKSSFQVSDHTSAFLGNQQFTSRNLVFNGCGTALQISWDWAWTMQGISMY
jgi:hypothetical protein